MQAEKWALLGDQPLLEVGHLILTLSQDSSESAQDRCSLNPQGLSDKGHFSRGASGSHKTSKNPQPTSR